MGIISRFAMGTSKMNKEFGKIKYQVFDQTLDHVPKEMIDSNVIPFKKRKYPKKKGFQVTLDDFEDVVSHVRKKKLKGFVALIWLEDGIFPYESFAECTPTYTVIGALETYKAQLIEKIIKFQEEEDS